MFKYIIVLIILSQIFLRNIFAQEFEVFFSDPHITENPTHTNNLRLISAINDAVSLPSVRQSIKSRGYAFGLVLGDNVAGFDDLNPVGWEAQYQQFLALWYYALQRGLVLAIVNGNHDLLRERQGLCNQLFSFSCRWNQKFHYYLELPTSFNIVLDTAIEFRIPGSFSEDAKNLLLLLSSLTPSGKSLNIFGHHRLDLLNHEDGVIEMNQRGEPYIYDYIRTVRDYFPNTEITYIFGHTHLPAQCRTITIDNKSINSIQVGSVAYPTNGQQEINYVYKSGAEYLTRYKLPTSAPWQTRLLCSL